MKKTNPQLQRQLRECQKQYARIKARIEDLGFICQGSLVERWIPCGKPNCRCHNDPAQRHGPYYQLSWKEQGKTVSQRLSPEHARLYKQWIANRRRLDSILKQMRAVSRKASHHMLNAVSSVQEQPAKRRRSRRARPRKAT